MNTMNPTFPDGFSGFLPFVLQEWFHRLWLYTKKSAFRLEGQERSRVGRIDQVPLKQVQVHQVGKTHIFRVASYIFLCDGFQLRLDVFGKHPPLSVRHPLTIKVLSEGGFMHLAVVAVKQSLSAGRRPVRFP